MAQIEPRLEAVCKPRGALARSSSSGLWGWGERAGRGAAAGGGAGRGAEEAPPFADERFNRLIRWWRLHFARLLENQTWESMENGRVDKLIHSHKSNQLYPKNRTTFTWSRFQVQYINPPYIKYTFSKAAIRSTDTGLPHAKKFTLKNQFYIILLFFYFLEARDLGNTDITSLVILKK